MARALEKISTPSRDDFAAMLEASFVDRAPAEGSVVKGEIVAVENDNVVVDVGLRTFLRGGSEICRMRLLLRGRDDEFLVGRHAAQRKLRASVRGLERNRHPGRQ